MEKTFENESGNIKVRVSTRRNFGCGLVEMLHLYDKNISGCVIGAWEARDVDGELYPEFKSVHDRFINTAYSFDIFEALKYGQSLAEVLTKSDKI